MTYVERGAARAVTALVPPEAAPAPLPPAAHRAALEDLAAAAGLRRIEIVAWRDLRHPEAGGSELHAARIAERWAAAGIDVVLRTSRAPGSLRAEAYDGYRVERLAGRYRVFPAVAAGAWRRPPAAEPDAVVEVWNGMPFLSPLWARGPRMVFLHHVHDGMWDLVLPAPLARVGKTIERRLAPPLYRRTPVLTLSESSRRTIIDELGFAPERVTVAPPGVDDRFAPGPGRSADPMVVAVGRLVAYKRFDMLLDVLIRLRRKVPRLRAVIAGEGAEAARLAGRIRAAGAGEWLTLAGRVSDDELVGLYRQAWVLASTSAYEGWGMTITEAARCGTPAVASRIPGHLDAVVDGKTGLLASTPREFEAALATVVLDPAAGRALGSAAATRAYGLTWDHTALGALRVLATEGRRG